MNNKKECSYEVIKRVSKNGNEYYVIRVYIENYVYESLLNNEQSYILNMIFNKE